LITVEQCRAARGLLGWSQSELASRAGLSVPTVRRFETSAGLRVSDEARVKLQTSLEAAGVEFIEENGRGAGVRFRSIPGPNEDRRYSVPMRSVQLRMARAAVGWGVRELAKEAGVTANTVTRIENGADAKRTTMTALQGALEAAGIQFTNGERPGVRLVRRPAPAIERSDSAPKKAPRNSSSR
jgi:transcriptional regulator with XRE-family HTH domain